jgi:hypothetical protein
LLECTAARHGLRLFHRVQASAIVLPFLHLTLIPFNDSLGVSARLAPVLSNISVRTRHLCFCLWSVNSPTDLSSFTKLWTICLLGILSSWNLCQNFLMTFSSYICDTAIYIALKYTTP